MPLNPFISDTQVIEVLRRIVWPLCKKHNEDVNEYINQAIVTSHQDIAAWDPALGLSFARYVQRHVWRGAYRHHMNQLKARAVQAPPGVFLGFQDDVGSSQRTQRRDQTLSDVVDYTAEQALSGLGPTQHEIIRLWALGLNYSQIGRSLGITRQRAFDAVQTVIRRKRKETQNRKD